ncbi:MAG TPA: AAA-like domain-containing protein, partial [Chthonomonadaceae bacterium]|nr:AAA-like domain-containing protein [Chthonomonadaceae bacterium]
MTAASSGFYISGGTLPVTAPSYVERRADYDLFDSLQQGEFCYVLTSRQMGKSSLMMRTGVHLREAGLGVVTLDLTALGRNLTMEQWYRSLCSRIGEPLNLEEEIEAFWEEHAHLSPLQRWTEALRHVVLEQFVERVVIFIDEIDFVRNLTFDTDEFFAAIRACYNRRAEDPAFHRLTFCLLGVALPSELIRNAQMTPFNIGRRISLNDFSSQEASVLAERLHSDKKVASRLLERILYWTGGHPYLTQKLCQAVAQENSPASDTPGVTTDNRVDRLCAELFLSNTVRVGESNLMFVANSILNSGQDVASLLDLYRRIWSGKRVVDDEASLLVSVLKLSGVIRAEGGFLQVRNRIYERVFDRRWIQDNMPGAELRRQRAAYFLGLLRAISVSLVLLTCIGSLAVVAFFQYERAELALAQKNGILYSADMVTVDQAYKNGEYGLVNQALTTHLPKSGVKDLRGFEWRYYWGLMHQDVHTIVHPGNGIVFSVAFSPNGNILASANGDGTIKLWDIATWQEVATLHGPTAGVFALSFSPNGIWLAAGCLDHTVQVWDVTTQRVIKTLPSESEVYSVAFSPKGRWLASGDKAGELNFWDVTTWRNVVLDVPHKPQIYGLAFSKNGRWLASSGYDRNVNLWEVPSWRKVAPLHTKGSLYSLTFSPNNQTLAVGRYDDGSVELWDISSKQRIAILQGHTTTVNGVAFSPDGRYLATGSWDGTIRLYDVIAHQPIGRLISHTNRVTSVAFSPNGSWLASGGSDEIKIWDPRHREENPQQLAALP